MEAVHIYETERAVGHFVSQAAAIREGSSLQSSQRPIREKHRRSRSRDSSQKQRVPLANIPFAPPQYPAGPSGPPWYPPPYWFYPPSTHPQQSPSLGTSTEPSRGSGRGASRINGRGRSGVHGRSASANGPRTKQQEKAQSQPSVGRGNRDACFNQQGRIELGTVILEEPPAKKPHTRDAVHAVGNVPDLDAKRQHRALPYVGVGFEDVFDFRALIDTGT